VYWPIYHKVLVKGRAEVLHVRAMTEVPVHLDDIVLELSKEKPGLWTGRRAFAQFRQGSNIQLLSYSLETEADENWLTVNAIAWPGMVAQ
jgi:hypothetical protein